MKEEALKLAYEMDNFLKEEEQLPWGTKQVYLDMASTMIRRLVEELDKWEQDLHLQSRVLGFMEGKASQTEEYMMLQKPLSDEEIKEVEQQVDKQYAEDLIYRQDEWVYLFAKAIEERHGIKNVQKT